LGHPRPFEFRTVSPPGTQDRTVTVGMQTLPTRRASPTTRRVFRERAKERWPTVLLTLVSIIQALALETLWAELAEEGELAAGGFDGIMAALQGTAVLLSIVVVWIFFAQLVMRFVWVPGLRDTMAPFAIGLIEFVLAEFISAGQYGLWIALLSLAFLVAHVSLLSAFSRAAQEPENADYFARMPEAPWRRHGPSIGAMAVMLLLAGVVELAANELVTGIAYGLVLLVLLAQIWIQRIYWYRAIS